MSFTEKFIKYEIEHHGVRLPQIEISKEQKKEVGAPEDCSNYDYLTLLCLKGFEERLRKKQIKAEDAEKYTEKCAEELDVFKKNNLVDYLLLVYDILNFCDKNKIARGVGRGSASGSLVLYLLKITHVDPIKHNLYFVRFINEARLKSNIVNGIVYVDGGLMPDVDSDVSYYRRGEVINYINQKYPGKNSKIGTRLTLSGKLLIKEVVKSVLEYSEEQAKHLSDMIGAHFGTVETIEEAYNNSEELKEWVDDKNNLKNKECFNICKSLEGLIKNRGQHPSGIAISFYEIDDLMPLELSPSKEVVTAYDMKSVAELVVKVDILGLKNADVNYEVCEMVGLDPQNINIDDESIYKYLSNSRNYGGLFQIECGLTHQVTHTVAPKNINQLCACLAISRPGAFAGIDKYVKYIHDGELESIYSKIDDVLKDTANIILYQEQVIAIAQKVYGLQPTDSELLRRGIGKKSYDELIKWESVIFEKGKEKNIPEEVTKQIWDTIIKSSNYLFCLNHSLAYSYMTAINTYLKTNYPQQFFLSLLRMAKNEPNALEAINAINTELIDFDIKILPPHLLKSDFDFTVEDKNIRFGLTSIKGISDKTIERLSKFKGEYKNKFEVFQASKQSKLNLGQFCAMIQSGALDDINLKISRSKMVLEACLWNLLTDKEKSLCLKCSEEYNFDLINIVKDFPKKLDAKSKKLVRDSRMETLRRDFLPYHKIYELNHQNEKLANYFYEKMLTGCNFSCSLRDIYNEAKTAGPELISIREIINDKLKDEKVSFVGFVESSHHLTAKNEKKTEYLKTEVHDETGKIKVLAFNNPRNPTVDHIHEINGRYPKENDIVIINGIKKDDCIFANNMVIQKHKVYLKLSEIEKEISVKEVKE